MFAFAAVLVALGSLAAALAPIWITSKRCRRTLARIELVAGAAGAVGAAVTGIVSAAAVRGAEDAEYAEWVGGTLSIFAWLFVGIGLGAAVLVSLAALVSPVKWHAVRVAVFPVAAMTVLLLTAIFAGAGENDGPVRADLLIRLFGLFSALLPALGAAADHALYLRSLPEDKKPERRRRKKR